MAPELVASRFRARKWMHTYNNHFPADADAHSLDRDRFAMLKEIIGKIGEGSFIEPPFSIDYGCNIVIGERFYANFKYVRFCF